MINTRVWLLFSVLRIHENLNQAFFLLNTLQMFFFRFIKVNRLRLLKMCAFSGYKRMAKLRKKNFTSPFFVAKEFLQHQGVSNVFQTEC